MARILIKLQVIGSSEKEGIKHLVHAINFHLTFHDKFALEFGLANAADRNKLSTFLKKTFIYTIL
jgi:hypothetical protein